MIQLLYNCLAVNNFQHFQTCAPNSEVECEVKDAQPTLSHVGLFVTPWTITCLEWVTMPFSRESSWPRDQTQVSHIAGRFFTIWAVRGCSQNKYTILKWVFSFTTWTKFFMLVVRYWCPSWQTLFRNQAGYLQSTCQSTVKAISGARAWNYSPCMPQRKKSQKCSLHLLHTQHQGWFILLLFSH